MQTTRFTTTTVVLTSLIIMLSACASTQIGSALAAQETAQETGKETAEATAETVSATQSDQAAADSSLLYELRTYTTHPGKLEELHSRFSNHTQGLFEKHGIKNVAYWTPVDTPNTLVYIIAHNSKEAAETSWKAFVADPQWRTVYAESQANGPLVANIESVFMTTTDYSPRF